MRNQTVLAIQIFDMPTKCLVPLAQIPQALPANFQQDGVVFSKHGRGALRPPQGGDLAKHFATGQHRRLGVIEYRRNVLHKGVGRRCTRPFFDHGGAPRRAAVIGAEQPGAQHGLLINLALTDEPQIAGPQAKCGLPRQHLTLDAHTVDEGAIGAPQIDQLPTQFGRHQSGMASRHGGIAEHDVILGISTNTQAAFRNCIEQDFTFGFARRPGHDQARR